MTYRHIVLFRIFDRVDETTLVDAVDLLSALGEVPGVQSWLVRRSLDERKGRIIVEEATFADADAFAAFRDHPAHRAAAARMAEIADWWIGDYAA